MLQFVYANCNIIKNLKNKMIMNKIINKIFPILTLALALSMTACLTDSAYDNNQVGIKPGNNNFVEIHLTSTDTTNTISQSFDLFNRDTTIVQFIPVNLTAVASHDVTVTFQVLDRTTSANIDTLVGKHGYTLPDPTKFVVQNANNQVLIPAGSHTGYIKVKFNPSNMALLGNIFGVKLTAVSDPSYKLSNLVIGYIKFGIKNAYEADYHCIGYRIRPGNATEPVDAVEHFNTVNATTCIKVGFGNYTAYSILIEVTSTPIVVGGVSCFKVNATPVNGATIVGNMFTNWTGDALTAPAPPVNPNEINYYNPKTKTFVLNCYYISGAGNRIMYEVLTRQ